MLFQPVARAWVGHGMSMISVGRDLVNQGPVLVAILQGEPGGLPDSENVHAVHLEARDVVTSLIELG